MNAAKAIRLLQAFFSMLHLYKILKQKVLRPVFRRLNVVMWWVETRIVTFETWNVPVARDVDVGT
jgi:hypothetical protein